MKLLYKLMNTFSFQVSYCLFREIFYLQISIKLGYLPIESESNQWGLGILLSVETPPPFFYERDIALFQCLRTVMIRRIYEVTKETPSH